MLLHCDRCAARKQSLKLVMMEGLNVIQYLERLHPLSNSFRAALTDILIEEHYRKHDVIYSPSHPGTRIWFVTTGHLYRYQLSDDKKVTDLYKKNSFILCCDPAHENNGYIKVLSDCSLITAEGRNLRKLLDRERDGAILERLLLVQEVSRRQKSANLIRFPLDQRVQILMADFPEFFRIASQDVICSYLNMSRESLRKSRNKF